MVLPGISKVGYGYFLQFLYVEDLRRHTSQEDKATTN